MPSLPCVVQALLDRRRVSVAGDATRPWLLASVVGGIVARFLDSR
jgi:hypothetical protein